MREACDEVLELVIPYVFDPKDLLRCSLSSSQHKAVTTLHIQQSLPQLLHQLRSQAHRNQQQWPLKELRWLCSQSRSTINTAPVLHALLQLLSTIPTVGQIGHRLHDAVDVMSMAGLRLTDDLMLRLAKQHHKHMAAIVERLRFMGHHRCRRMGTGRSLSARLPLLLCWEQHTTRRVWLIKPSPQPLWRHQMQNCPTFSLAFAVDSMTAAAVLREATMPGRLFWRGANPAPAVNVLPDALLLELLLSGAVLQEGRLKKALAAVPPAQLLGADDIMQVLQLALAHATRDTVFPDDEDDQAEPESFITALMQLPGAQNISTESITHAMELSVLMGYPQAYVCRPLLDLPKARHMESARLCNLVFNMLEIGMLG